MHLIGCKSCDYYYYYYYYYYRKAFDSSDQFNILCRILTDPAQPMTVKVKQAWLEYVQELIPLVDSEDFKETSGNNDHSIIIQQVYIYCIETRQAFTKLLALTLEPKSVEVRKGSQKVVTGLFDLNPSVFSLLLRGVPHNLKVIIIIIIIIIIHFIIHFIIIRKMLNVLLKVTYKRITAVRRRGRLHPLR